MVSGQNLGWKKGYKPLLFLKPFVFIAIRMDKLVGPDGWFLGTHKGAVKSRVDCCEPPKIVVSRRPFFQNIMD